ncbi:response regulator receiver domain-containing protein [Hypnocyclicus thermotrophus]|uniref:Response regulator receiver domain-containing protein n=1 Tax=Hypnocyclicus thermotrophus TaxID=1627895 RepID=A0AA46E0T4_9FUSO|nr:HD domain-containing phosphohydrolase [Hypnocyclicus thermotrophus]TDT72525.1 response regulator receiver domain-containing protein [Hypnocyclicus thermotrophus]
MNELFHTETIKNNEKNIGKKKWKIIIADDEPDIHSVTKLVLKDFKYDNKKLELINCYNDKETKHALINNKDTAIILLDVVMNKNNSGLEIVKFIRNELNNRSIRIILRTGQPGLAPERNIILNYDINDYKEKTELTAQKLITSIISSLRAYKEIINIERNKLVLEKIISIAPKLFKLEHNLKSFSKLIADEFKDTFDIDKSFILCVKKKSFNIIHSFSIEKEEIKNIYKNLFLNSNIECLKRPKDSLIKENIFVGCLKYFNNKKLYVYFENTEPLSDIDKNLINIFWKNIGTAVENIILNEEILSTQKDVILTLGEAIENRSEKTNFHVKRISEYAYLFAKKYGLDEHKSKILKYAAPLHDIGKIGITEKILNKPTKLKFEEFEVAKQHAQIGHNILKISKRALLQASAIIAYEHHEKWDGTGYPRGLKGKEINIFSRIISICDVFDSMLHPKIYRKEYSLEKTLEYIKSEKGKHFEPKLVDILLENIEEFIKIKNKIKNS